MPENDELRAAAELVVARYDHAEYRGTAFSNACWKLARAYLAHPPLTRERVEKAVGELVGPYKSGLFDPAELADGLCRLLGVDSP